MLIPSGLVVDLMAIASLSRRVNANSQPRGKERMKESKLIKKGEC